jgi:hypothetical protein
MCKLVPVMYSLQWKSKNYNHEIIKIMPRNLEIILYSFKFPEFHLCSETFLQGTA